MSFVLVVSQAVVWTLALGQEAVWARGRQDAWAGIDAEQAKDAPVPRLG
jgi:hypothetical protein